MITIVSLLLLSLLIAIIYGLVNADKRNQAAREKKMVQELPYDNGEFRVEHTGPVPGGEYTISLYAILNGDSQLAQYNKDLKQYKQDSLDWLKSFGVNPDKLKIMWLPDDATKL